MYRLPFQARTNHLRRVNHPRGGHTLMELIVASIVVGMIAVPSVDFLRLSVRTSRKIENSGAMLSLATGVLEEQMALTFEQFTEASLKGNFANEGYPHLRYSVLRSTRPADGGKLGLLMAIHVEVWSDDNNNQVLDSGEFRIALANKVAKLANLTL